MMRKRRLQWDFDAWEDYLDWQRNDKKILKRINQLIREVVRDPLRHGKAGASARKSCRILESAH